MTKLPTLFIELFYGGQYHAAKILSMKAVPRKISTGFKN
jgi:hypothetical protein